MTSAPNPFVSPRPRGIRFLQGTLRVVVVAQCWGQAAAYLHLQQFTPVASLMEQAYQVSAAEIALAHRAAAIVLLICGFFTLLRPCWPVLIPVGLWQCLVAASATRYGTGMLPAVEPMLYAPRIVAPLALMLIDLWPPRVRTTLGMARAATGLMQVAVLLLFLGHSIQAFSEWQKPGPLHNLLVECVHQLRLRPLPEVRIQYILLGLGVVEISSAVALAGPRQRGLALWLTVWSGVLAMAYTIAYGMQGYAETLMRAPDVGCALSLFIFWTLAIRRSTQEFVPEPQTEN